MNNTEAKRLLKHIISRQNHARRNSDGTMSLVLTWKGAHHIATFHQTSINDLMDDTWSIQVNSIGNMDIIVHSNDPIQYDEIPQDIDGNED